MSDMLPENKLDVINNLRQNKFLILHYSKIKILVYVFLLCYLVTENTHFFKDNGVSKMILRVKYEGFL